MSFFQKSVVSKYLNNLNKETVSSAFLLFKEHFLNPDIQKNIRSINEEQYQQGFFNDLFVKVLGYTLSPNSNFNLLPEYKNEKDSKKADGAIVINNNVRAVIELKDTKTTDLGKVETQAFGYKNNQKDCPYVIISNFEKLRFYVDNSVDCIEFNLFTLSEEDFTILYLILSYESIEKDIPKKLKSETVNQDDITTKKLYNDYSVFKKELFQNLIAKNPNFDKLTLFKKSQKLIDRLLFIFFAEDRGLLPPNSVRQIIQDWQKLGELDSYSPLYSRFQKFFGYLNTGYQSPTLKIFAYNGGLFEPDEVLDSISIDDEILNENTLRLSRYDFETEVDVNILGHIFEHSLNEIEEIQSELEGKVPDKSKSKRKKDGIFYTPKYITKYIVENTLGTLCSEKRIEFGLNDDETEETKRKAEKKDLLERIDSYRKWLLELTICDPACGSGAFLNQALDFLLNEHRRLDELTARTLDLPIVFSDIENSVLENNIFGVDINEEAVEIAKLSLWLRTAQRGRKLNTLSNNIKCGNSLIDDPAVAGDKAFNWQEEFPRVFKSNISEFHLVTFATKYSRIPFENIPKNYNDVFVKLDEDERIIFAKCLAEKASKLNFKILATAILPDHIHLVLATMGHSLSKIMNEIKGYSAYKINEYRRSKKSNYTIYGVGERAEVETPSDSNYTLQGVGKNTKQGVEDTSENRDTAHIVNDVVAEQDSNYTIYGVGEKAEADTPSDSNYTLQGVGKNTKQGVEGTSENRDTAHILKDVVAEQDDNYTIYGVGERAEADTPSDSNYTLQGVGDEPHRVGNKKDTTDKGTPHILKDSPHILKDVVAEHIWGRRYSNTFLDDDSHLYNAINYVNNNYEKHKEKWGNLENEKISHILKDVVVEIDIHDSNYTLQGVGNKNQFSYFSGGFDVIIGNPPYGAELDNKTKEYFKTIYNDVHYRTIDTFNYFISKSLKILNHNGFLSLIVPNNLLYQHEYFVTRKLLVEENKLIRVINLGDSVFQDADVPTCVFIVNKIKAENYKFEYKDIRNEVIKQEKINENFDLISSNTILQLPSNIIGISDKIFNLIEKVNSKSVLIDEIAEEVASGISSGGDKIFRISKEFAESNLFEKELLYKVLVGSEMNRYALNSSNNLIIYSVKSSETEKKSNIYNYLLNFKEQLSRKRETLKGTLPWYCLHWPRYKELFTEEKVILRQTSDDIRATYDNMGYFTLDSILILKLLKNDYSYKFITSLLNSKIISFIYKNLTMEEGRTFAQVKPINIRKLPIPNISPNAQLPFIEKADLMLKLNKDLQEGKNAFITFIKGEYNLDRINTKLEEWYNLPFDSFTKELEKLKVKLTSTQKYDLKPLFDREAAKLLAIKTEIETTDREIDQMVYKLYDLTEEEIKIVEGK